MSTSTDAGRQGGAGNSALRGSCLAAAAADAAEADAAAAVDVVDSSSTDVDEAPASHA